MPNITLSLDPATYKMIKQHADVNWSEVARKAFRRRARELHPWDELLSESKVTERDALRTGDQIKKAILKRLGW